MATPADALKLAAWRTVQKTNGEPITYHVHSTLSIPIERAILTQPKTARIDITDSVGFESRRWHWLIDPNDLANLCVLVTPEHGHWIMRGEQKYILLPDNNDLVWRWSDASQVWRRVFCSEA